MLNVHNWIEKSRANGPGERFVLWLQGCTIRCKGCWNKELWSTKDCQVLPTESILGLIPEDVSGVSISGGEPFQQPEGLLELVSAIRESGRSVLIFTGYTLEDLRAKHQNILRLVDILVAGLFIEELAVNNIPLVGSSNQKVHFLTPRYTFTDIQDVPTAEIYISEDGVITMTGFGGNTQSKR